MSAAGARRCRRCCSIPAAAAVAAGAAAGLPARRRGSMSLAALLTLRCAALLLFVAAPGAGAYLLRRRPQHRLHRAQHLRRLHHQRLQRQLHRPRARDRPADAGLPALLPRHVPGPDVRHEPGAARQQHRPDVGGGRAGDADHRADGRHLPHARGARGGVEILHPRQRRHRARAVRHHPRLPGGAAGARRGPATPWSGPCWSAQAPAFDPALLNLAFVFLLLGYGTKVGLAPLHAWLPDAHAEGPTPISAVLSGLLLNVALYAVLRFKMLLAANPAALAPGPLMVDDGAGLADLRRASCSTAAATSSGCSPTPRSSTWASSPSPSAWAGRSPTSPACCT